MFTLTRKRVYIIAFTIITIVYALIEWHDFSHQTILIYPTIFEVYKGDNVHTISRRLAQYGTHVKPNIFEIMVRTRGIKTIYAGEYEITPSMTSLDLLHKFSKGQVYLRKFTIVEGWNIPLLLIEIQQCMFLKNDIKEMSPEQLLQKLKTPQQHLEGLFFPDTYSFARNTSVSTILIEAHLLMKNKLEEEWKARESDLPYQNPYQALIVASLIEKETAIDNEREIISAVIANRLKKNMYLQIDPTIIYGLGEKYKGTLTRADINTDSAYNTYKRKGLPPTPIGFARLSSIHAALHPAKTDALYFVASGNGGHIFTSNLKDHLAAVEKLKKLKNEAKL